MRTAERQGKGGKREGKGKEKGGESGKRQGKRQVHTPRTVWSEIEPSSSSAPGRGITAQGIGAGFGSAVPKAHRTPRRKQRCEFGVCEQ